MVGGISIFSFIKLFIFSSVIIKFLYVFWASFDRLLYSGRILFINSDVLYIGNFSITFSFFMLSVINEKLFVLSIIFMHFVSSFKIALSISFAKFFILTRFFIFSFMSLFFIFVILL